MFWLFSDSFLDFGFVPHCIHLRVRVAPSSRAITTPSPPELGSDSGLAGLNRRKFLDEYVCTPAELVGS